MSACERCNEIAEECTGLCWQCQEKDAATEEREEEIRAQAIAAERARIRGWLGQQAAKANRDAKKAAVTSRLLGMAAAFKEAADHLKPAKVKGHLKRKRAARAAAKGAK